MRRKISEAKMTAIEISRREYRGGTLVRENISADERTFELSFSSEAPVMRWWGVEVLGHGKGEMDEAWIGSGRAPMLVDHEASVDNQIGVVEKVWLEGGKGRAKVRFGKSARASEIFERVQDGELSSVSVGYEIRELKLVSQDGDVATYRATRWTPFEISIVTVPADMSVGVGRARSSETIVVHIQDAIPIEGENIMSVETETRAAPAAPASAAIAAPAAPSVEQILATERARVSEIEAIATRFNCRDKAAKAIQDGITVELFRGLVLDHLGSDAQRAISANAGIGMTEKEVKQFSFLRAINAIANPNNRLAQEAASFEREASEAVAKKRGKPASGILVPVEVLRGQRDLVVGTDSAGGYLKDTELRSESFIDMLRNRMMVRALGATVLTDLQGDIAIPRQTGGATAYWVAESGAVTESAQTFDQVSMAPKTLGGYTDISRKLLIQSSIDIENLVRSDLATVLALEVDRAAIHGSGSSNQPTGIVATSGIGSVAGGTNGAAPDWSDIVDLETAAAVANADIGNLAYLTNAKVRGKLKQTEMAASSGAQWIWKDGNEPGFGMLNGYRAAVSNQVSSALTKGTSSGICSAIIFGNFADLFIGMWSGVDLTIDPYTGATSGTVRVVALQDCDIAVRHAASFSAMLDALTA